MKLRKVNIDFSEQVELNVKVKRGVIKPLLIDEEIYNFLRNKYELVADKKKIGYSITSKEACLKKQEFNFSMKGLKVNIISKFDKLYVIETKKNENKFFYEII